MKGCGFMRKGNKGVSLAGLVAMSLLLGTSGASAYTAGSDAYDGAATNGTSTSNIAIGNNYTSIKSGTTQSVLIGYGGSANTAQYNTIGYSLIQATSVGAMNQINASYASIFGSANTVSSKYGVAIGYNNHVTTATTGGTATGNSALALGYGGIASGDDCY